MALIAGLRGEQEVRSVRVHRHRRATMEAALMLRTTEAGAHGRADADWVAGGDGEHAAALPGEGDGGGDHAGGLDGDEDLTTWARVVAVVALAVARSTAGPAVVVATTGRRRALARGRGGRV